MFFKYMKKTPPKKQKLSLKKIWVLPSSPLTVERCMPLRELLRWEIHEEYRKYGVPPVSLGLPTFRVSDGCWVAAGVVLATESCEDRLCGPLR